MISWIVGNLSTILIGGGLLALFALAVARVIKTGGEDGCSGCSERGSCALRGNQSCDGKKE